MTQKISPWPITIRIGYQWADRDPQSTGISPAERYKLIKSPIQSVVKEVEARAASKKGTRSLYIQIGRMRARHGSELLPRFRELCEITDIIIFDITGENPNVMLELGMALSTKCRTPGHVYVFKQGNYNCAQIPSDLRGYFVTCFDIVVPKNGPRMFKLQDSSGFRAALRSTIIDLARKREMWADRGVTDEEDENDKSSKPAAE